MIQKIDAPISVISKYDHRQKKTTPVKVMWEGREYQIVKIGLHHQYRKGRTLFHVFSISSVEVFFRIELNTENLQWRLTEITDDLPN